MKKIRGFPDYQIDPKGQVWSFLGARKTKNGETVPRKLTPIKDKNGRLRYTLVNKSGRFTKYASDLVVATFERPKKPTEVIVHLNGDTTDSRHSNLKVVDKRDVPLMAMKKNATPEQAALTKHLRRQIKLAKTKTNYGHLQQAPKAGQKKGG